MEARNRSEMVKGNSVVVEYQGRANGVAEIKSVWKNGTIILFGRIDKYSGNDLMAFGPHGYRDTIRPFTDGETAESVVQAIKNAMEARNREWVDAKAQEVASLMKFAGRVSGAEEFAGMVGVYMARFTVDGNARTFLYSATISRYSDHFRANVTGWYQNLSWSTGLQSVQVLQDAATESEALALALGEIVKMAVG